MGTGTVHYREYTPCEALRGSVRALFAFSDDAQDSGARAGGWEAHFDAGERICAPTFADGHACVVFTFSRDYWPDGVWRPAPESSRGAVIGPMTVPGPPVVPARRESIGAYLRPGSAIPGVPASELEDRVVPLEDLWGPEALLLAEELEALGNEGARIERLESALVRRLNSGVLAGSSLDVSGMASWIAARGGQVAVERLAEAAGFSRQHMTRVFRASVGVTPKMYCQLSRFRSTLRHLRWGGEVEWALVAAERGYADQSHLIAEFRRFCGLTPEALRQGRWFHPFIESPLRSPESSRRPLAASRR